MLIDSFTVLQETIEERYLNRKRALKQDPNYLLQPPDYKFIKNAVKSIILDLIALDMNIVCTAKSKPIYDNNSTEFMSKIIGYRPDVRLEVPGLFDVVIELKNENGIRKAIVHKDRTNTLTPEITEFSYQKLAELFGEENLKRPPVILRSLIDSDKRRNRTHEVDFNGQKVMTAGVTTETLTALTVIAKNMDKEEVLKIAMSNEKVKNFIDGKEVVKTIVVPDKLVNIVV